MNMNAKFWQKLSTAVLWACIAGLMLLFPVMVYLLQPTSDIQQNEIRHEIQLQKNILSQLRAETALLTSGHRDDPREEIISLLDQLYSSVYQVDVHLGKVRGNIEDASRSWERYANSLDELQEIILNVSSASALYGLSVTQLESVFIKAEGELQKSDLPTDMVKDYDLQMVKMMLIALRYAALPSDSTALRLEAELEQIRIDADAIPSAQAQKAFGRVVRYVDGLMLSTQRIRENATRLTELPSYYHLDSFDTRFEDWVTKAQEQQRQSRWTLLAAVVLLISAVIIALVRLKFTQERLLKTNSTLTAYKKAMDEHAIVSITDPRGRIEYVNKKFVDVSGFSEAELIGSTHKVVNSGVHPKGFFKALWDQVLSGETWHDEVCNRRKDGNLYWVNATVVPILDEERQVASIISVRTDISAIKQTERALTAEKERAEVANKAKGDFLANMSHEIRTPMNAVIGMSHLARQASEDEQVIGYIDKIQHSAQNLLSIINDILDFSKIEAGRLDVEQIPFRLDNVINHLADVASVKANEKNLPLLFDIDERIPHGLEGDPLRLGQVLLNLVNNAIKFTNKGEVVVSGQLLEESEEQVRVRFSVTDTGIGLSKEQIGRLFQSFSQADTSTTRQYGGTGLGLAISKQLVELMNGEIGVHSVEGEGSEFFITLSFKRHEEDGSAEQIDLGSIRVLAVDDDNTALQGVRELLESQGVAVETESDAPAGLNRLVNASAIGEEPFNVLLIDWQMPIMDGFEVAKAVRNNSSLPWQPAILMLTAHGGEDLQRRINHNLIDGVLLKPVTGSHLLNAIQQTVVKRSRTHQGPTIRTLFREGDEINALLGAKVLIAEDNLINQEVITGLLEPYGLDLTVVGNGREAVNALQQSEFDLVFMDIQMPEVDGLQATGQILQMQLPKTPPIIAMTAHAQSEDVEHCLAVGMQDHIAKPIDPEKLKEKLIRWIEPRVISGYSPEALNDVDGIEIPCYLPGVNINKAMHSLGGNVKLLMKLMAQFCSDYQRGVEPALELMATGDWDTLKRWLHTLKGTSATLGMEDVAHNVDIIERMGFDQMLPSNEDLKPLNEELLRVINSVTECMQSKAKALAGDSVAKDDKNSFAASLQPSISRKDGGERLKDLVPQIMNLLEQGDPEVLDLLPELLELLQLDADQMALAIQVMEHAEVYEFDEALNLLTELQY
ncbi:response regulator [Oceanospirillum sanctuarii]|uniref:response regulator n=1 Tax=Oceanospirillum sanctuarii TaxID=1434821 RepID=UPI0015944D3F|nr:response regulator [Oceanospirillum sanctuarii]